MAADVDHQDADETIIPGQQNTEPSSKGDAEAPVINEQPPALPSLDILGQIKSMYRLLDLINEQGPGGIGAVVLYRTWLVSPPIQLTKLSLPKNQLLASLTIYNPDHIARSRRLAGIQG
jgi:hypothetical protein